MREFLGHFMIILGCLTPGIVDYNNLVGNTAPKESEGFGIIASCILLVGYSFVGGMIVIDGPRQSTNDEAEDES